jgi:hypothetical protein
VEQRLGRVFRELEPYSLFPITEYFHGPVRSVTSSLTNQVVQIRPHSPPQLCSRRIA